MIPRTLRLTLSLVSVLLLLVLSACGQTGRSKETGPGAGGGGDPLNGTSWVLASIDGASPLAGVMQTAEFKDGQVSGTAGCNSYGGSYKVNGSKINVTQVISTMMACADPQGIMDQESAFLSGINKAKSFSLEGGKLQISTSDGKTLVFTPKP